MKLRFTKMQGLGNDFVVLDGVRQRVALDPEALRALADRHFGVGADQILLVEPATRGDTDFRYRIFNADGGEVEQCGNGARCFVRFVHDHGLTGKRAIRVETQGGIIEPRLEENGEVTVDMGVPSFEPAALPFDPARARASGKPHGYLLDVAGGEVEVGIVSMGNPHAVQVVSSVRDARVAEIGPLVEGHRAFPRRVNAGFLEVVSPRHVRLRVYERGSGETLACGTGACAAVVTGIERGLVDRGSPVRVETRGGALAIRWAGAGAPVLMTGPAVAVFEGEIEVASGSSGPYNASNPVA